MSFFFFSSNVLWRQSSKLADAGSGHHAASFVKALPIFKDLIQAMGLSLLFSSVTFES